MKSKYDYIIVGQGIAGSVLSFLLKSNGRSVLLIDDGHPNSASRVAAGMWNPISFKSLNAGWNDKLFLDEVFSVYPQIEKQIGKKIFHPTELARIFPDTFSANQWEEKSVHPETKDFLSDVQDEIVLKQMIAPHGHGVVKESGWLDVQVMLESLRTIWKDEGKLLEENLNYQELKISKQNVSYKQHEASHLIFCTGTSNRENPFFNFAEVRPNKGQVLSLKIPTLPLERMLNYGNFLLPLGFGKFKAGSTYEFDSSEKGPTDEGRNEILQKLAEVFPDQVDVLDQVAGYRPTTYDRRPIIGLHPEHKRLYIFNGFGSRAVMMVPFFSKQLIDHIERGSQLEREASPLRFLSKAR